MGIFNGKTKVCFEIPDEQYETLKTLFRMAEKENPDFDTGQWFSEVLIGEWIAHNWRNSIKKMAWPGKSGADRRKKRVARK